MSALEQLCCYVKILDLYVVIFKMLLKQMSKNIDIVIVGAGIAGLWTFNRLKRMGYDVLLLESKAIGSGQTIASQGIIHSGLKYAFAGKVNNLAKSISAMPACWKKCLRVSRRSW